jgi:hypothetical protein
METSGEFVEMPKCDQCHVQASFQNIDGNFCVVHWKQWLAENPI